MSSKTLRNRTIEVDGSFLVQSSKPSERIRHGRMSGVAFCLHESWIISSLINEVCSVMIGPRTQMEEEFFLFLERRQLTLPQRYWYGTIGLQMAERYHMSPFWVHGRGSKWRKLSQHESLVCTHPKALSFQYSCRYSIQLAWTRY